PAPKRRNAPRRSVDEVLGPRRDMTPTTVATPTSTRDRIVNSRLMPSRFFHTMAPAAEPTGLSAADVRGLARLPRGSVHPRPARSAAMRFAVRWAWSVAASSNAIDDPTTHHTWTPKTRSAAGNAARNSRGVVARKGATTARRGQDRIAPAPECRT